jgi:type 1 glutamine amidotransferase
MSLHVEVSEEIEDRVRDLDDVDLVVVNAACGADESAGPGSTYGLRPYLERGGSLLAVHAGAAGTRHADDWAAVTGATWVDERSMHPEQDLCRVQVVPGLRGIGSGLSDFDVFDERYSWLRLEPGNDVICAHTYLGTTHPLAWARKVGPARVVSDLLGHGPESYDFPGRVALLRAAVTWLTAAVSRSG